MFITRRMDYGIRIMLTLGLRTDERMTGQALAEAVDVPRDFVLKVVQSLKEAGLVQAQRGVGGGVQLAKSAEQISLFDVLAVTDGVRALNPCLLEPRSCSRSRKCAAHRVLDRVQVVLDRELKQITLADLVKEQIAISVRR